MLTGNLATSLLDGALERGFGPHVAFREPKRVWSYQTLADESARAGAVLAGLGVRPGETVALLLHDSMELAAALLGAMRIGAIAVPVSILLRPLELRALLSNCGAVAVVVSADLAAQVDLIRTEVGTVREVLAVGGSRAGQRDFHALVREADPSFAPVHVDPDSPALVLYSAGAGRTPRGVAHCRRAVEAACESYAKQVLSLGPEDRVLSAAKLSSAYGLGLGLLFPLAFGASSYLLPARPRPRTLFDVMAAFRPTVFAAAPSLYAQMIQDHRAIVEHRPNCFQSVRHAVSGAEGMPAPLAALIFETFGIAPLHGFGVTEALHFVMSNRVGDVRPGSVGRPLAGVEAQVVDEMGHSVGAEEMGLLELRGTTVAKGYFQPQVDQPVVLTDDTDIHTVALPRLSPSQPGGAGGWLRLGDRFLVDRDGFYFHCGRDDDLFKVGGRWVSPEEVEQTLLGHPAVWECAVVEGEDEMGLPLPHAYVVPNVGHSPSPGLATALMEYVKAEIAPYKYPRAVEFVDSLPKSESGRVERWQLRPSRRRAAPP